MGTEGGSETHGNHTEKTTGGSDSGAGERSEARLAHLVHLDFAREAKDDEIGGGARVEDGEQGRRCRGRWEEDEPQ